MQTIKVGKDFTGFYMLKHKACGAATRVAVGPNFQRGYAPDGTPLYKAAGTYGAMEVVQRQEPGWGTITRCLTACKGCGKRLNIEAGNAIYGRFVAERICNGVCMNAVGPSCDCSCGGELHGSNH